MMGKSRSKCYHLPLLGCRIWQGYPPWCFLDSFLYFLFIAKTLLRNLHIKTISQHCFWTVYIHIYVNIQQGRPLVSLYVQVMHKYLKIIQYLDYTCNFNHIYSNRATPVVPTQRPTTSPTRSTHPAGSDPNDRLYIYIYKLYKP